MDTMIQRATRKINIKLFLSKPTENKFPETFFSGYRKGGRLGEVGKWGSLDVHEHCSEQETVLLAAPDILIRHCQPYVTM
jgi:hypothetical protein